MDVRYLRGHESKDSTRQNQEPPRAEEWIEKMSIQINDALVTVKTEKQIYAAVVGMNGGFFYGGAMRRELPTLHCIQEDHVIKFRWAFRTRAGAIRFALKQLEIATAHLGAPYQAMPVEKKQSVTAQRRAIWNHA